jgi:predicted SAM-dependent methyltransferase
MPLSGRYSGRFDYGAETQLPSFRDGNYPKRLNVGCGWDIRPGYLNIDLHERHGPDLVADVTDLNMLPSNEFEEIVAMDVLEHVERHKVQVALNEWSRLSAPEAVLHVRVPSLEHMFKMLCWPQNRRYEEADKVIHLMYGTQAYTGDYHLAGFTAAVLEHHLNAAGFLICRADIMHSWLFDVSARKTDYLKSTSEFVHSLYFRVLGRPADPLGLNHFVTAIDQYGMTREAAVSELEASDEARFLREWPSYLLGHIDVTKRPGNLAAEGSGTPAEAQTAVSTASPAGRGGFASIRRRLSALLR